MGDILDSNEKNSDSDLGIQKGLEETEIRPYVGATPSTDNIKLKSPSVKSVRAPSGTAGASYTAKAGRI